MSSYAFVLAKGTWTEPDIEREHVDGDSVEVRAASLATPEEVERQTTEDVDGVIVTTNPLPRELIERFGSRVRIVARAGIGLDAIDLDAAKERGIAVFHTPDYATEEVATHTVALILGIEPQDHCRRCRRQDGLAPLEETRSHPAALRADDRSGRGRQDRAGYHGSA